MSRGKAAKIFIVHGRAEGPKNEVALFIERLGLQTVILHEQPNNGRTLMAKFQDEASNVAFAVVIMTPDDDGGLRGEKQLPRARQNVIFELGFFIGKMGAQKVCALVVGQDIERPSDFDAVAYVQYGPQTNWKIELARELKAAGIEIDTSRLL